MDKAGQMPGAWGLESWSYFSIFQCY